MNEILKSLGPEIAPLVQNLLTLIITIIFGILGEQARRWMNKAEQTEIVKKAKKEWDSNKEYAEASVAYVQQIGDLLTNDEKLKLALTKATEMANRNGNIVTEDEMRVLIESAYHALKEGFQGNKKDTDISDVNIESENVNVEISEENQSLDDTSIYE